MHSLDCKFGVVDRRGRAQAHQSFAASGSPRRVTATAQLLYHRFHLFFPLKDFQYQVSGLMYSMIKSCPT